MAVANGADCIKMDMPACGLHWRRTIMSEKADHKKVNASALGQDLTDQESQTLAEIMGVKHLKDGDLLINEGDAESTLYLLADGKLSVTSKIDGKDVLVYTMSQGECAGTRAFVDRSTRKATLRALGDATVYTLAPKTFESLLDKQPRLVYNVMRALFRITHTNLMRMNLESQQLANYISKSHGRY